MVYKWISSSIQACKPMLEAYLATLRCATDDFWEEYILDSQVCRIVREGETIGIFGIHGGDTLTFFYTPHVRLARTLFVDVLQESQLRSALVLTGDEGLLSLCLDRQRAVDSPAQFFAQGEEAVAPAQWARSLLRPATASDPLEMLRGNDEAEQIARGEWYVLCDKQGAVMGQGFIKPSRLQPGVAAMGVRVYPAYRLQGVGRSMVLHLAKLCRSQGMIPYCGCWRSNEGPRRMLESAGFVSRTRLLKIGLQPPAREEKRLTAR